MFTPLYFNLDWIIGISVSSGNNKHVILYVYLKSAGGREDHMEIFQGQLEELNSIIDGLDTTSVSIIGDLNADLVKPSHPHGPLLRHFASDNGLVISSEQMLPKESFTFISEMRPGDTSWLDHCISTQDGHNIINNMFVNYQLSCRDHVPLVISLCIDKLPIVEDEINDVTPKINWDKCDAVKLREYSLMSDIYLSRLSIPRDALGCRDTKCQDENHILHTKNLYNSICKCFTDASKNVLGIIKKG